MKVLHVISFTLVVVGAINWGLIGGFDTNLVSLLVGSSPAFERLVYILVGLSGVYLLTTHKIDCMICSEMMMTKKKSRK